MEENPETVLIAVDTSFDTSLVVIPPRSATIADVREKIKQGHMALYPSYGSISVLSVKVELFNRHYLLEETHKVGQIFRGWQGSLHVELAGYPPNSPTASRLRLPLISTGDKAEVNPIRTRKHPLTEPQEPGDRTKNSLNKAQRPVAMQPDIGQPGRRVSDPSPDRTVVSQALEEVGSQKSSDGRNSCERCFPSQDVVLHRPGGPEGQGIETVEAGLDIALDALLDVGPERQLNIVGSRKLDADSNGRNVGGTQSSPQLTPRKAAGSKAQFSGNSMQLGERKRRAGEFRNLTGSQDVLPDRTTSADLPKQVEGSSQKKNSVRAKSDVNSTKADESVVKTIPKLVGKTVDVKGQNDTSSNETGPDHAGRKDVEGEGAKAGLGLMTDSTTHGKRSEEAVVQANQLGKLQTKSSSGAVKFHSSGSSSSESSEKNLPEEPVKKKTSHSSPPVKRSHPQGESSDESSSLGGSSKSYRPEGSAGTRDVDEVVNKLVNLYSPIISDDSGGEQSSDASEERQPKGLRSRIDSSAAGEADNTAKKSSRRESRHTAGLNKFQHFIDSQDGLDQLLGLTLSARKSKPSSEAQIPVAGRGTLGLDSLSIDVVPDTQVGNLVFDVSAHKDGHAKETVHAEKNTGKSLGETSLKQVEGGNTVLRPSRKDGNKSPKSKSKAATLSADTNDDPSDSLQNFATIASESARKLDSNEDLLQPKSDDSQQFLSAVQLTRLAMADEEDDAESDPMQSPRDKSVEKKEAGTKMKVDASITSQENVLTDNAIGTDPARSGLATDSVDCKEDKLLLPEEHPSLVVHVNQSGTDLNFPRNVESVAEQFVDRSVEKRKQLNAVVEGLEEDVEQQSVERAKLEGTIQGAESSEAPERKHNRIEFATPGKSEKKKLSARRIRAERRNEENEPNVTENGGDRREVEPAMAANGTENAPYVEDSPTQECRVLSERQEELSIIVDGRPADKSGRKKKVKRSVRPAESSETERREERGAERSGRSPLEEIEEFIDRGPEKRHALLGRLAGKEIGADDDFSEKNETVAMITPRKRKTKKSRVDVGSHSFGSELPNAGEACERLRLMKSSSNFSSNPFNADGDLTHETLPSVPQGENFALQVGRDNQTIVEPPVVKKKKKTKRSVEQPPEMTDAEMPFELKESNQGTSDIEAALPVPEPGQSKPPRPRKKNSSKLMEQSPNAADTEGTSMREELTTGQSEVPGEFLVDKHRKELKSKLAEEINFADLDSKDGILAPKPASFLGEDPYKKDTSLNDGVQTESVGRKKKKRAYAGIGENIPSVVLDLNSSPGREDGYETKEDKMYFGTLDDVRLGAKTVTPKKKKKKRLLVAEEENDEALEPSCNQLGYRGSGVGELHRDAIRGLDSVNDLSKDEKSTGVETKTKRKRVKCVLGEVEKAVTVSSSPVEDPGSRTSKPRKKKHLTDQELNGVTVNY